MGCRHCRLKLSHRHSERLVSRLGTNVHLILVSFSLAVNRFSRLTSQTRVRLILVTLCLTRNRIFSSDVSGHNVDSISRLILLL